MKNIFWLDKISVENKKQVGEKALNLAELYKLRLPMPEVFVLSSRVYEKFLEQIKPEIENILNSIVDENSLKEGAAKIKWLFLNLEFPDGLKLELSDAYRGIDSSLEGISKNFEFIKASREPLFVAVRSSSTYYVPDQQSNFLGIKGMTELIKAIKYCWASLFTAQAIAYRKKLGITDLSIAVIIQKMVNSTRSGVIFTSDPTTTDSGKLLIEAEYGFSKKANPSQFLFDKATLSTISTKLKNQRFYYLRDSTGRIIKQAMPPDIASLNPLPEDDAKSLINMAKKVEEHFGSPQIIEWCAENRKLFLLQTYPLILEKPLVSNVQPGENMVLRGLPIFTAQVEGLVSVIKSKEDTNNFQEGDILVTDMTNPYLFFAADKAKAVIVNGGGFASHAIQLSKELDKPCIIGAENATSVLNNGDKISIDENGFVYREAKSKPDVILGEAPVSQVTEPADLNLIFNKISDIEKQVTELVYQDAERRIAGQIEDRDYSKLLSDIEWDIREIRKKLQNYLSTSNNP